MVPVWFNVAETEDGGITGEMEVVPAEEVGSAGAEVVDPAAAPWRGEGLGMGVGPYYPRDPVEGT